MIIRHVHRVLAALVLFMALEGVGHAGSFQVSPVRATLSATKPIAALKVRNTGSTATVIQLQAMRWTQLDDQDALAPAADLLATPPIFTLEPGASQVIRVGSRQPADANVERAYRLLLKEVPPPAKPGFVGLRIALKISLPVFAQPAANASANIQWRAIASSGDHLLLIAHNTGNKHAHLTGLTVTSSGHSAPLPDTNVYVLAGATRTWRLAMHATSGQTLHLAGHDDESQAMKADVVVTDR